MLSSPLGGKYIIKSPLGNSQRRVAGDWWLSGGIDPANCIAAYQPIGAADYATSKVNLANPGTHDATEGVAPDWDAVNGWKFNGINDYLDSTVENRETYTMIVRFNNVTNNAILMGCRKSAGNCDFYFVPDVFGLNTRRYSWGTVAGGQDDVAGSIQEGVMCLAGDEGYLNGIKEIDCNGTFGGDYYNIYIGALNQNNSNVGFIAAYIQAIAIYSISLIGAQILALTTAMVAL